MRRQFGSIIYSSMSQFVDEIIECEDLEQIDQIIDNKTCECTDQV